ncbi:hypothetical protein Q9Q60_05095 [Campylobacter upsaliensis]|uniref:hypothetical protein n=1 Tax=Campylobacter upsaliensis TaxID=28080 RepID=UPI002B36865C|nr:hypothetical protein [Campylobacter upsaliensis]MEB2807294.1 hypothetical protein [Campylobacter upsaliensis]
MSKNKIFSLLFCLAVLGVLFNACSCGFGGEFVAFFRAFCGCDFASDAFGSDLFNCHRCFEWDYHAAKSN